MGDVEDRLEAALAAIDAANAEDPTPVEVGGLRRPKELVHAERMSRWLARLDPAADAAQQIAARAHHLRRWTSPRGDHPDGRAGYLRWRTAARKRHAEDLAALLDGVGIETSVVERAQQIVRKEGLGSDPQVQVHEDALCLVFLELQLAETVDRLGDEKMLDVIRKTAAKMSPAALAHVAELDLRDGDRALIARALDGA